MRCITITIIVTLVTMMLLGQLLSKLGVGPYWAEYHSSSGVKYACMYETRDDFIQVTLDNNGDHYHDE